MMNTEFTLSVTFFFLCSLIRKFIASLIKFYKYNIEMNCAYRRRYKWSLAGEKKNPRVLLVTPIR